MILLKQIKAFFFGEQGKRTGGYVPKDSASSVSFDMMRMEVEKEFAPMKQRLEDSKWDLLISSAAYRMYDENKDNNRFILIMPPVTERYILYDSKTAKYNQPGMSIHDAIKKAYYRIREIHSKYKAREYKI